MNGNIYDPWSKIINLCTGLILCSLLIMLLNWEKSLKTIIIIRRNSPIGNGALVGRVLAVESK